MFLKWEITSEGSTRLSGGTLCFHYKKNGSSAEDTFFLSFQFILIIFILFMFNSLYFYYEGIDLRILTIPENLNRTDPQYQYPIHLGYKTNHPMGIR